MGEFNKGTSVYLIFNGEYLDMIGKEISNYSTVMGKSYNIADAVEWAGSNRLVVPDIFLINGNDHFLEDRSAESTGNLISVLRDLKDKKRDTEIVIFFSEGLKEDTELVEGLKELTENYHFVYELNTEDLKEWITNYKRSPKEIKDEAIESKKSGLVMRRRELSQQQEEFTTSSEIPEPKKELFRTADRIPLFNEALNNESITDLELSRRALKDLKVFVASELVQVDEIVLSLESDEGIRSLQRDFNLSLEWAEPLEVVGKTTYRERIVNLAKDKGPDVIILHDNLPGSVGLMQLIQDIRYNVKTSDRKSVRIVLLTSIVKGSPQINNLIKLGVWDIVDKDKMTPLDLITSIYCPASYESATKLLMESDTEEKETIVSTASGLKDVIMVWSPFETGKTFISSNLALAMALKGLKTVLIDLDTVGAALESVFNIQGESRLALLNTLTTGNFTYLDKVYRHPACNRLRVLSLPLGLPDNDGITGNEFMGLYDYLREDADVIILDGPKEFKSDFAKAALRISSKVLCPITQDPFRVLRLGVIVDRLINTGVPANKIEYLFNFYTDKDLPSVSDIEDILGYKTLPYRFTPLHEYCYKSILTSTSVYIMRDKELQPFKDTMSELIKYLTEGAVGRFGVSLNRENTNKTKRFLNKLKIFK